MFSPRAGQLARIVTVLREQTENITLRVRILTLLRVLLRCRRSAVVNLIQSSNNFLSTIFDCAMFSKKEKVDHGAFTMVIDHGDRLRLNTLDTMRDLVALTRSEMKASLAAFVHTVAKCSGDASGVRQSAYIGRLACTTLISSHWSDSGGNAAISK